MLWTLIKGNSQTVKNVQLTHSNASLTLLWAVPTPHATLHHAPHRWRCPHLCNNLTYLSTPLHAPPLNYAKLGKRLYSSKDTQEPEKGKKKNDCVNA